MAVYAPTSLGVCPRCGFLCGNCGCTPLFSSSLTNASASWGLFTVTFNTATTNAVTPWGSIETEVEQKAREAEEARQAKLLRHREALALRMAERRRARAEAPRVSPPPAAPSWQASVRAFRGRSGVSA